MNLQSLVRPDLAHYHSAPNLTKNEEIKRRQKSGEELVNLAFGQSPFPVIEQGVEALRHYADVALYLPPVGIPELRQLVVEFHEHYDAFTHFNADSVVVGPGSKELIYLIMQVFNGVVFIASPSWTSYKPQTVLTNKQHVLVTTSREDSWKLTTRQLQQALTTVGRRDPYNKLLILCNPDNPSGQCYRAKELEVLSNFLRMNGFVVISDEIYARLHFLGQHDSLATYYPEGTIVTSGLSKWASAGGWRLGYAMFPQELSPLLTAVSSACSHTFSCAPAPMQYAAVKILSDAEAFQDYINHCRRILKAVADFCYQTLSECGVQVLKAEAGYYLLPDFEVIRTELKRIDINTGQAMCELILKDLGVALIAAGPAFCRPEEELTVRLCFTDFDGTEALYQSQLLGLEVALDGKFVERYCQPTASAVIKLSDWVNSQRGREKRSNSEDRLIVETSLALVDNVLHSVQIACE